MTQPEPRKQRHSSPKISIREVAERARVSHATVSRVLNNVNVPIAPETRELVRSIAAEMGYQPNRAARALATGRTQTIALWASNLRSAHYGDVIHYTHEEIVRHGYELLVSSVSTIDNTTLDTSKLLSWPVDGILGVDLPRGAIPGLHGSLLDDRAFVNIGGYVVAGTDYVQLDFKEQASEAVRHLSRVGCQRIVYIVPNWFEWFEEGHDARYEGYNQAMAELGRKPEYVITSDEKRESVRGALEAYIAEHGCPDGVFCYNDDMAIGCYPPLRDLGIQIPEDIAIVGCDGIRDTSYLYPALSTIVQPLEEMCAYAWSFLKRRIDNPTVDLQQIVLEPRLEIRGSSSR
jgi:LacI family transcriptional regulator